MKRTIIEIDEELCNGCGLCVEGCHEGALQLINGKAVIISDLYCDGLGACIGDCPVGAISIIEREAVPYDEVAVIERIAPKGEAVILAHLKHLRDYNQMEWFNQAIDWLRENNVDVDLTKIAVGSEPKATGCSGATAPTTTPFSFAAGAVAPLKEESGQPALKQWPVQLHLLNPHAPYLQGADLLLASDCSGFATDKFHTHYLKHRALAIACPKLDSNKESYIAKLREMIDGSKLNSITLLKMEVPCCGGLLHLAKLARDQATRKIPIKSVTLSIDGRELSEEWL